MQLDDSHSQSQFLKDSTFSRSTKVGTNTEDPSGQMEHEDVMQSLRAISPRLQEQNSTTERVEEHTSIDITLPGPSGLHGRTATPDNTTKQTYEEGDNRKVQKKDERRKQSDDAKKPRQYHNKTMKWCKCSCLWTTGLAT